MKTKDSDPAIPADLFLVLFAPLLIGVLSLVTSAVLFGRGWAWAAAYLVAVSMVVFGGVLIFRAKFPVYRQRRFFTFGSRVLPNGSVGLYRKGWRFVFVGAACAVVLLIVR